ncbi:hypothetical protein F1559_002828 [Cyanidiococcus yangmingshanensis]|uniref:Amine oxidase domain-containing protein n=1 Tax=Cyanidiococcus yangmingshanensis TaxID=2690220 RepID=A0A7J7IKC0_9RHOD|nr:hypothetical protein F1559_002828 [Cyanidiococcus yangmingshanensis]
MLLRESLFVPSTLPNELAFSVSPLVTRTARRVSERNGQRQGTGKKARCPPSVSSSPTRWRAQVDFPRVRIVGAGLSGLATATSLIEEHGWDPARVEVYEAANVVGGRVRTDRLPEGFLLDRGFQVLLEAYPEQRRLLRAKGDTYPDELKLGRFLPGATVRLPTGISVYVGDPFRNSPSDLWATLRAPLGTFDDKLRIGLQRLQTQLRYSSDPQKILEAVKMRGGREETAEEALSQLSASFRQAFFAPFYRGIFLDELSNISSRLFRYIYHMLAVGYASLPDNGYGIEAVPRLLERRLRDEHGLTIHLGQRVTDLNDVASDAVVVLATDIVWTKRLLEQAVVSARFSPAAQVNIRALLSGWLAAGADGEGEALQRLSTCLYFAGDGAEPPKELTTRPRALILNADEPSASDDRRSQNSVRRPLMNHLCFPSSVARSYAPANQYLVSCSVVETAYSQLVDPFDIDLQPGGPLDTLVRAQLHRWYPTLRDQVDSWRFLRAYRVRGAQPRQRLDGAPFLVPNLDGCLDLGRLYVCGDWCDTPTANGALHSGIRVASGIAKAFGLEKTRSSTAQ